MKRTLILGGAAAGIAFLAKRGLARGHGVDFGRMVERMPDDAPPKWMFRNVSAIRENTDRILELLEAERDSQGS